MKLDYGAIYNAMHESNAKEFPGYTCCQHAPTIAAMVAKHKPKSLLDYGCGKGYQYLGRRIHEQWGGLLPVCYDPGVRQLAEKPKGPFDGVICCDVLEHIDPEDVEVVLADILSYARKFAFLSIACVPSKVRRTMPDGRNVHLTVQPPEWWQEKIAALNVNGIDIGLSFDLKVRA